MDVRDNIELPDILPEEFGGQYSRSYDRDEKDPYTPDDYKNIQTCLKLSPENWMKFHQWVALQSSANAKYIGVVSTLSVTLMQNGIKDLQENKPILLLK